MYEFHPPAIYVHESVLAIPSAHARAERMLASIDGPMPVFPHEARARVYRFLLEQVRRLAPDMPVSLCGETPQMWEELADELRMTPDNYVCTCGPDSVPGNALIRS
jgi:hypothetical protein